MGILYEALIWSAREPGIVTMADPMCGGKSYWGAIFRQTEPMRLRLCQRVTSDHSSCRECLIPR